MIVPKKGTQRAQIASFTPIVGQFQCTAPLRPTLFATEHPSSFFFLLPQLIHHDGHPTGDLQVARLYPFLLGRNYLAQLD